MDGTERRIGEYRLLEVLGEGGMGVVIRAEHLGTGELVALKTVRLPREALLQNIRREIHALARLRHPGIVRIVAEGLHEGLPWYAMELVQGATLRGFIRQLADPAPLAGSAETTPLLPTAQQSLPDPWWTATLDAVPGPSSGTGRPGRGVRPLEAAASPPEAIRATLDVVCRLSWALAFLHGEGIVHRDLKPENVLVRPDGRPVLVDFGLTVRVSGPISREVLEEGSVAGGTALYMAPEQSRGKLVDARADLYALGCILYELICGRPPFLAERAAELIRQHQKAVPPRPSLWNPAIPDELEALILRLLEKDPRRRLGAAAEIAVELGRLGTAGETPGWGPAPRAYLYRPGLGGREEELQRLESRLRELRQERGGMVLLGGESGIGKTRLALELCRKAVALRLRILLGECPPPGQQGAASPLVALRGFLRSLADRCQEGGLAVSERLLGPRGKLLAQYQPELAEVPGQEAYPEPAELPAQAARLRLYGVLGEVLEASVEAGPALLVLDDLHWADELSLDFLHSVLRGGLLQRLPLLVLGTYRTEETSEPLHRLLESPQSEALELGRLTETAVGRILRDMLALPQPPAVLGRYLARQSEGNPFFIAEYLRLAVEEGLVFRNALGRWEVRSGAAEATEAVYAAALPLPRSLLELVGRRLEGLGLAARRIVQAAAVLGREVRPPLVQRLAGLGEEAFLDGLTELFRRQVLHESEAGLLRFTHDKLREVAHESLPLPERTALHRAAAEGIEQSPESSRSESLEALARHWAEAGDSSKAAEYSLLAGQRDLERSAFEEALHRSRDAVAHGRPVAAALLAAEAYSGLGRFDEALAEAASAAASASSSTEETARARLIEAAIHDRRGHAHESLAQTAALLDAGVPARLRLRALLARSRALWRLARWDEALASLAEALELGRRLEAHRELADALNLVGLVNIDANRYAQAAAALQESLALRRAIGDRHGTALTLNNLGILLHDRGAYTEALAALQESLALRREIGDRHGIGMSLNNLGMVQTALSLDAEALASFVESLALRRAIEDRYGETNTSIDLGKLHAGFDRLEPAESMLSSAIALAEEQRLPYQLATALVTRARVRGRSGTALLARADAERALGLWQQLRQPYGEGHALSVLARLDAAEGRLDEARERLARARRLLPPDGNLNLHLELLGDEVQVLAAAGELDAACQAARAAAELARRHGAGLALRRFERLLATGIGEPR